MTPSDMLGKFTHLWVGLVSGDPGSIGELVEQGKGHLLSGPCLSGGHFLFLF